MSIPASVEEIKGVVWSLVSEGDLESLTRKKIRGHVRSSIPESRLQRTDDELKDVVKGFLPELLDLRDRKEKERAARREESRSAVVRKLEPTGLKKRKRPAVAAEDAQKNSSDAAAFSKLEPSDIDKSHLKDESKPKIRNRTKRRVCESDNDSSESYERETGSDARSGSDSSNTAQGTEYKTKSKPFTELDVYDDVNRGAKRKRKPTRVPRKGKVDPRLAKVLRVARELGCRIPPRVLVCNEEDKLDACVEYLKSKGVEDNALKMNSTTIKEVRARLERETELRALDVGNIISSESRRSRRATVKNNGVSSNHSKEAFAERIAGTANSSEEERSLSDWAAGGDTSSSSSSGSEFELSE